MTDTGQRVEKRPYHLTPDHVRGGWNVYMDEPDAEVMHFDNKQAAIIYARHVSRIDGVDLYVHDEHNDIDWVEDREEWRQQPGVELRIKDEKNPLPHEVEEALEQLDYLKGIPRGQPQPKK